MDFFMLRKTKVYLCLATDMSSTYTLNGKRIVLEYHSSTSSKAQSAFTVTVPSLTDTHNYTPMVIELPCTRAS